MDDTSTNIANDRARLGSSLRLDENQTVISGMTTDTPCSSSSAANHRHRNHEAASAASSSASASILLPHDRFRGGTASRFVSGGSSNVGSGGSRGRGGSSVAFDVIDEEEGGGEQEEDTKLIHDDLMEQQQQHVTSSNIDYMDTPSSSIPVSSTSSVVVDTITQDEQQNILLSAYDNSRLPTHNPKTYATQEINVLDYQDVIYDADELSSLPEEYLLDEYGNRYHHSSMKVRERLLHSEQQQQHQQQTSKNNDTVTLLLPSSSSSSLESKRRWTTSLVTIFATVALAVMGIIFSIQSLSIIDYSSYENDVDSSSNNERHTPPPLLPSTQYRQFGGVLGGLLSWGGVDAGCDTNMGGGDNTHCRQRSSNGGGISSSVGGSSSDIVLASPHLRTSSSSVAVLTSSPLHSYVPLLEKRKLVSLQQLIQSSPYNPRHEIPMVWNVPLSDGGSTIELVFGNCLKLVQCNGRGHEILSREHALEFGGTRVVVVDSSSSSRRAMMKVISKTDDGHLLQYPPEFNPHLQTEVVFTSTFVNVDCTTPLGIDRGILHNLAMSDMSDVIHSPDIYDVARLFVPSSISSTTPNKKTFGRGMVILRNPIEMAVAKYLRWKTFEDDHEYCARHWARGDVICKLYWTQHPRVMVKESTRPWDWNLCCNTLTFHLNQKAEEVTYHCNKQRLRQKLGWCNILRRVQRRT